MASAPRFPSAMEVQALVNTLNAATNDYNDISVLDEFDTRMKIISAARAIVLSMTDPADLAHVHLVNAMELVAIRTLVSLKVFNHIPTSGSVSLPVLSSATGATEALLERLLRMLVCTGIIQQLDNSHYAHTRLSVAYAGTPGPETYFTAVYDNSFLAISSLHTFLHEKGLQLPTSPRYSPFTWTAKQEGKSIWEIMAQDSDRLATFQSGLGYVNVLKPLTGYYPFDRLDTPDSTPILVDVGGGAGQSIVHILQAHPDLPPGKFVLQDFKEPLAEASARPDLPKEVVKMQHDFFTPQPVKHARAYLLRHVLSDYSDELAITILQQIVPAMAPDSTVLIGDYVIPPRPTMADAPVAMMDVALSAVAGKERTEDNFKMIMEGAGLEFVRVWRSKGRFGALAEGRLPRVDGDQ